MRLTEHRPGGRSRSNRKSVRDDPARPLALRAAALPAILRRAMASPADRPAAEPGALANLNARSREIFRRIVESYLASGEPVGLAALVAHAADLAVAGLGPQRDAGPRGARAHLRPAHQRRPAADPAGPALLRRRAARVRRPRPGGAGADRQPGARRRRGRRLRRRAGRDHQHAFGPHPRRRRRADDQDRPCRSSTSNSCASSRRRRWRCWSARTARSRTASSSTPAGMPASDARRGGQLSERPGPRPHAVGGRDGNRVRTRDGARRTRRDRGAAGRRRPRLLGRGGGGAPTS